MPPDRLTDEQLLKAWVFASIQLPQDGQAIDLMRSGVDRGENVHRLTPCSLSSPHLWNMDYVTCIPVEASGAVCYVKLIDGQWHACVEGDDVKSSEQLRSAVRATVRCATAL